MSKRLSAIEEKVLKSIRLELEELEKIHKTCAPITRLKLSQDGRDLLLYENRVVDRQQDIMVMLDDPKLKIDLSTIGEIRYSIDVSGGKVENGSLGGMILGGMIAGPLGAMMGATASHSDGIKTKQITIDDRQAVIKIETPSGIIAYQSSFVDDRGRIKNTTATQDFYNQLLVAKESYTKNKKHIDEKLADTMELEKLYYSIKNDYTYEIYDDPKVKGYAKVVGKNKKKQDELTSKINALLDKKRIKDRLSSGFSNCARGILLVWVPFLGIVLGIIGIIKLSGKGVRNKSKAIIGIIMGILSIVLGIVFTNSIIKEMSTQHN